MRTPWIVCRSIVSAFALLLAVAGGAAAEEGLLERAGTGMGTAAEIAVPEIDDVSPRFRIAAGFDQFVPAETDIGEPPLLLVHPELGPVVPIDPLVIGEDELRRTDAERAKLENEWFPIDEYWDRVTEGLDEWTQKVSLGARYLSGNSNEIFVDLGVDFERREETRLTQVNLGGQFGEANGVRGTNRWFANSNTDRDVNGKKWLVYTQVRDRYDEFERLDYRGTLSAGAGYRFYDTPERRLITRLGPAVTYELYHAPQLQRVTPDIFGEIEARWPVKKRVTAEHKTSLNPSLLDIQLLRVTSTSGISWAMDEAEEWSLKLGFLYIYNGMPNTGRLPSDYTGTMSVVYLKKP